jgi:hypothetical protein
LIYEEEKALNFKSFFICFLVLFLLFLGLNFLGVSLDLFFNPWIRDLKLEWWNVFTTKHYFTWLYSLNFFLWLLLAAFLSGVISLIIAIAVALEN